MTDHTTELPAAVRQAVATLSEPVPASGTFRQRVLVALHREPSRWSLRPWQALAAALAFMLLGVGASTAVQAWRAPSAVPPLVGRSGQVPVRFRLVAPGAASVTVVGDFNQWNPASLPLTRSADGRTWEIEVPLAPGRYAYSFLVDGALALDPGAPRTAGDDFGSPNSVVMVKGS